MTYSINKLFIDGHWVSSDNDEGLQVINPANGEAFATAPMASARDAVKAVEAARRAFDNGIWPRLSPKERGDYLRRLGEVIERRRSELVDLVVIESGFPRAMVDRVHVQSPIDVLSDIADRILPAFSFMDPVNPNFGTSLTGQPQVNQGVVVREPVGVASLIIPYNAPIAAAIHKLSWALAAGCTIIIKPSPYTPLSVLILGELVEEVGFPPGVINIITGDLDASIELTTNPGVDIISFTGSDAVGALVMAQAAPTLKKVVLELGGKSANIIFEDADLDRAALEVMSNMVVNCGQGCLLLNRTLAHVSIHDELIARVVTLLSSVKIGDPNDSTTLIGPLISEKERSRIEGMIRSGEEEGATIAFGGKRPTDLIDGYYLEPTLFVNVNNSMSIAQKEFFGPVGVIIPFKDEEDAIRIANDSPYGLNAGIFTTDTVKAFNVAKQIRCGNVNINSSWGINADAPFGGYKRSGMGREGGGYGISEFLEYKFISWPTGKI
ncbi:aldehyde dehydrogenase family protein [Paenibacillus mendelii]|uniref:Aldehyde dehydrogenase family protein n=1 Tax=Paenibacillus mendelii TaxID=206163 RepID=A0ABV6JDZ5_9BACL|nr:aldehyde dehydrogenase family protein [Paenibacillus mendelii]MCQ6563395.1 aldehyde dehydrogenase family protein [Paenibacillus mendelii]